MAADELVDRCRLVHGIAGHAILTLRPGRAPGWNEPYEYGSNLVAEGAENLRPVPLEVGVALEPTRQQSTNALLRFPPR